MLQPDPLDISALAPAAITEVLDIEISNTCLRSPSLMRNYTGLRDTRSYRKPGYAYAVYGKHQYIALARRSMGCWRYIYLVGRKHGIILDSLAVYLREHENLNDTERLFTSPVNTCQTRLS